MSGRTPKRPRGPNGTPPKRLWARIRSPYTDSGDLSRAASMARFVRPSSSKSMRHQTTKLTGLVRRAVCTAPSPVCPLLVLINPDGMDHWVVEVRRDVGERRQRSLLQRHAQLRKRLTTEPARSHCGEFWTSGTPWNYRTANISGRPSKATSSIGWTTGSDNKLDHDEPAPTTGYGAGLAADPGVP
jgi:hypothetical protein